MKTRKTIDLPVDDVEWFYNEFGADANLTGVLTMLLHNFRSIHQDTGVTPKRVAKDAAKELNEAIKDGTIEP